MISTHNLWSEFFLRRCGISKMLIKLFGEKSEQNWKIYCDSTARQLQTIME